MPGLVNNPKSSQEQRWPIPHLKATYGSWQKVNNLIHHGDLVLDGQSLDFASLIALTRYVKTAPCSYG